MVANSINHLRNFTESEGFRNLKQSSIKAKLRDLRDFFKTMGINDIDTTKVEAVENFITILRGRKNSRGKKIRINTINHKLNIIREFFKFVRKIKRRELVRIRRSSELIDRICNLEDCIDEFEFIMEIKNLKTHKKPPTKPFSLLELKKLLEATLNDNDLGFRFAYRNFLMILFSAIGTGARNNAIRLLKKKDLDCSNCIGSIFLKFFFLNLFEVSCNNCIPSVRIVRKDHTDPFELENDDLKYNVSIEKKTCALLRDYIVHNSGNSISDYVFESTGFSKRNSILLKKVVFTKALSNSRISNILRKAKRLANLPDDDRTFHSLRRTFISSIYKNGTKYDLVSRQVDHQSMLGVTGRYTYHHNMFTVDNQYESSESTDWDIKFIKLSELENISWRKMFKALQNQKLEEIKLIASKKGGECLSKKFRKPDSLLKFRCKEGHEWETKWKQVRYGAFCHECGKNRKFTLSAIQDYVKKHGGECLSKEYINPTTKLKFRCKKKHEWEATWNHIGRGTRETWCPKCAGVQKLTFEDINKIARRHMGKFLSNSYENTYTIYNWECIKGHKFKRSVGDIKYNHTWCQECNPPKNKLTLKFVNQLAKKKGGRCLSTTYKDSNEILSWECKNKHQFFATYAMIKWKKYWCPICTKNSRENQLSIQDMQEMAKIKGGKCLSKESDYKNVYSILRWRCEKKHEWEEQVRQIRYHGQWCPICNNYPEARKITLEDMQKIAKEREGQCLSRVYRGPFKKMKWKCKENHDWYATPMEVKYNWWWCPTCFPRKRTYYIFSIEQIHEYAKTNGGKCLSTKYKYNDKLTWVCKNNHKFKVTFGSIRKRKQLCLICEKEELLQSAKKIARLKGGQCLSNKLDQKYSKLFFKCEDGHEWRDKASNVINGAWCLECENPNKYSLQDAYELAYKKGGICHSLEYKNDHAKLSWNCKNNHEFQETFALIRKRNQFCLTCEREELLQSAKKIARLKGGQCFSLKLKQKNEKLVFRCKEGHDWRDKASNVINGDWCLECEKSNKYSLQDAYELAYKKGGICHSLEYKNDHAKLSWECKDGHFFHAKYEVARDSWCSECN